MLLLIKQYNIIELNPRARIDSVDVGKSRLDERRYLSKSRIGAKVLGILGIVARDNYERTLAEKIKS